MAAEVSDNTERMKRFGMSLAALFIVLNSTIQIEIDRLSILFAYVRGTFR